MLNTKILNLILLLTKLPLYIKISIFILIEAIFYLFSIFATLLINDNIINNFLNNNFKLLFFSFITIILFNFKYRFYSLLTRFSGIFTLNRIILIFINVYISTFILNYYIFINTDFLIISNILFIYFGIISIFRIYSNLIFRYFYNKSIKSSNKKKLYIYGASYLEKQICQILLINKKYDVLGYIDDSKDLQGRRIDGISIYKLDYLEKYKSIKIDKPELILSIQSLNETQRINILKTLSKYGLKVNILPNFQDLNNLIPFREINENDLLSRQTIEPINSLLDKNIKNHVVMVTGAGGSIGSEICLQCASLFPKKIILLDHSEIALYDLTRKILSLYPNLNIEPILLSVINYESLFIIIKKENPYIIFHAAAYKHVPLIEINANQGLINNIIGTYVIAEVAKQNCIKNIVLISSDKAVRPTNIMGASKRISEMIFQEYGKQNKAISNYSIVRFGNVIGSSGSVVPKFIDQIKNSKKITITHNNITRYFMTIREAAQLVIQASSLGGDGKIFLLDMGQPVKIIDLARRLIELQGLTVKDTSNPDGDVEIIEIGLRKGEKMYEELLTEPTALEKTIHPKIFQATESSLKFSILIEFINKLKHSSFNYESHANIISLLKELDIGFTHNDMITNQLV